MSFNSLPPELVDLILEFSILDYDRSTQHKHLASYSLISKSFGSASNLIWKNLLIETNEHLQVLLECFELNSSTTNVDRLSDMVKELEIGFQLNKGWRSETVPTKESIIEGRMISYDDFIRFITLTLNLQYLILALPTFTTFQTSHIQTGLLFPSLTTLYLTTPAYDSNQSLLRQILLMAPTITSLKLYSQAPIPSSLEPLAFCPLLKTLVVGGSYWERVLFDLIPSFIPLEACRQLEFLQVSAVGGGPFKTLPDMVEAAAETLLHFDFEGTTTSDTLLPTFSKLKVLKTLDIWIRSQPVDLLHLIPSSVKNLHSVINIDNLIYLQFLPRPELNLKKITFTSSKPSSTFLLLPHSATTVHLLSVVDLNDMLKLFEMNFAGEMRFRKINELVVHVQEGVVNEFRSRFKEWGIDLIGG